jgi:hypothetical protein
VYHLIPITNLTAKKYVLRLKLTNYRLQENVGSKSEESPSKSVGGIVGKLSYPIEDYTPPSVNRYVKVYFKI